MRLRPDVDVDVDVDVEVEVEVEIKAEVEVGRTSRADGFAVRPAGKGATRLMGYLSSCRPWRGFVHLFESNGCAISSTLHRQIPDTFEHVFDFGVSWG